MPDMKKRIPDFKSEEEERQFWATADSTEYVDWQSGKRKKLVRPDIQIFIAGRQALDLQLEVGDVKQSVEVTATQPLLETETSSRGQTLTPKMYQTLPLWFGGLQNPSAFLTYMSGVNSGSELSIAGSTGRARAVDRRHNERYCRVGRHRVQSALGRGVQRGQVADRTVLR